MGRIVYLDGQYLKEDEAKVSIFDRGFLFGDAVYEVTAVINGKLVDNDGHMIRLQRSCNELQIELPVALTEITAIQKELIKKNHLMKVVFTYRSAVALLAIVTLVTLKM